MVDAMKMDRSRTRRFVLGGVSCVAIGLAASPVCAQVTEANAAGRSATTPSAEAGDSEIVVTAQKREERLGDVPLAVTAITSETLLRNNQVRIQDYFATVPGFNYTPSFQGEASISIRGLTTGRGLNPTVGVTIDDIPYGSSTGLGGGYTAPDFDPSDLARIEVLRGPQGTVYGASSIGGLLKYVTVDPSTDGFSGRIEAGVNAVRYGGEPGLSTRGAVNLPMDDTLAVRVSGFYRRDPGYIDNVTTGKRDVNSGDGYGGRISILWRPNSDFSLKLGALLQDQATDGMSYVNLPVASNGFIQRALPGTGTFSSNNILFSAVANVDFGSIQLVSVTAYGERKSNGIFDYDASPSAPFLGASAAFREDARKTKKFSQEVRLNGSLGSNVDWLLGGFYTSERTSAAQAVFSAVPVTGDPIDTLLRVPFSTTFNEYAAFGNVTLKLSEEFDIQFGARQSRLEQGSLEAVTTGSLFSAPIVAPAFNPDYSPALV